MNIAQPAVSVSSAAMNIAQPVAPPLPPDTYPQRDPCEEGLWMLRKYF
jgi:hypothetical protein